MLSGKVLVFGYRGELKSYAGTVIGIKCELAADCLLTLCFSPLVEAVHVSMRLFPRKTFSQPREERLL